MDDASRRTNVMSERGELVVVQRTASGHRNVRRGAHVVDGRDAPAVAVNLRQGDEVLEYVVSDGVGDRDGSCGHDAQESTHASILRFVILRINHKRSNLKIMKHS